MIYELKYENIADGKRDLKHPHLMDGVVATGKECRVKFAILQPGAIFKGYFLYIRDNGSHNPVYRAGRPYYVSRRSNEGVWICDMTSDKTNKDFAEGSSGQEKQQNQERRRRWQDFCYYPLSNTSKSSPNSRHSRLGKSNVLESDGFILLDTERFLTWSELAKGFIELAAECETDKDVDVIYKRTALIPETVDAISKKLKEFTQLAFLNSPEIKKLKPNNQTDMAIVVEHSLKREEATIKYFNKLGIDVPTYEIYQNQNISQEPAKPVDR